jgi:hypothetical protein
MARKGEAAEGRWHGKGKGRERALRRSGRPAPGNPDCGGRTAGMPSSENRNGTGGQASPRLAWLSLAAPCHLRRALPPGKGMHEGQTIFCNRRNMPVRGDMQGGQDCRDWSDMQDSQVNQGGSDMRRLRGGRYLRGRQGLPDPRDMPEGPRTRRAPAPQGRLAGPSREACGRGGARPRLKAAAGSGSGLRPAGPAPASSPCGGTGS